jgi:hypothetical protein
MKHFKMLGLAVMATLSLMACLGAGTTSATTLEVGGLKQTKAVTIEASIQAGSSMINKDTNNATYNTCTGSTLKGSTATFTGATVTAPVSSLTFTGCSHKTVVIKPGTIHFASTGGTNATFSSSGTETTIENTVFGASCIWKTGAGTVLGTLTGSKEGRATIDLNGLVSAGLCGHTVMTGTYTVTSPMGLGVEA